MDVKAISKFDSSVKAIEYPIETKLNSDKESKASELKITKNHVQVILTHYDMMLERFKNFYAAAKSYITVREHLLARYYKLKEEKPKTDFPKLQKAFAEVLHDSTSSFIMIQTKASNIGIYSRYWMELLTNALIANGVKEVGRNFETRCWDMKVPRPMEGIINHLTNQNTKYIVPLIPMPELLHESDFALNICLSELAKYQRELNILRKKIEGFFEEYRGILNF